jgi:hypothetical protein
LTKKSGSRGTAAGADELPAAVDRLRRQAAPALAKALELDRAEAAEAALSAVAELALAAREFVRALPLPPESRKHMEAAEREALRAARLAVASFDKHAKGRAQGSQLKEVKVDFDAKRAPTGKRSRTRR